MHAADMVHLRHLIPFYMLLSDTPSRRDEDDGDAASGIDLRSAAQAEAEGAFLDTSLVTKTAGQR
ncbi:unnamed protein product [Ectocarpus sp. CCAP 1310/34]|nr:unnamed protein product [Ectocarpus sp. CCAP 1310/34]